MKELSFDQMEKVNGGGNTANVVCGISTAAWALGALTVATGFGAAIWAVGAIGVAYCNGQTAGVW